MLQKRNRLFLPVPCKSNSYLANFKIKSKLNLVTEVDDPKTSPVVKSRQ